MPRTTKPKAADAAAPDDTADQRAAEEQAPNDEPSLEEYEKHRLEVLARLPKEEDRPKNIYARLAQIFGFVGMIRKTGWNDFHKYRFAKESDLTEEIRPMLSEYGIWIEQGLYADPEKGFVAHERLVQSKKDKQGNISEANTLTAITKRFRFVWWNPESKVLETTEWQVFMGYGDDTSDKGIYKAETGSVKYFLMKTFLVATGDDPEADRRADQRAAARDAEMSGSTGPVNVQRSGGRPAAPGGRQQQTSQPQARQIGELLRANKITTTIGAIQKLESITGDKVEIEDPEDMPGALQKYIAGLAGPKAGAIVQRLKTDLAEASGEGEEKPASPPADEPKPAAAQWTDDPSQGDLEATDNGRGETEGSIPDEID